MIINLEQAKALVEAFGGDEDLELTLVIREDTLHEHKELVCHDEYPEHGFTVLGDYKS